MRHLSGTTAWVSPAALAADSAADHPVRADSEAAEIAADHEAVLAAVPATANFAARVAVTATEEIRLATVAARDPGATVSLEARSMATWHFPKSM